MVNQQVNKLKGEKYKLIWKDSPDFVRLASKLDCTIVPFAAVGGGHHQTFLQRQLLPCCCAAAPHNPRIHLSTRFVLHVAQEGCTSAELG